MRSKTSMVQTIGRAARNVEGKAVLYADRITESMQYAIDETNRRREKQMAHNEAHGITPQTIKKNISGAFDHVFDQDKGGQATKDQKLYAFADSAESEFLHDPQKLHKHIDQLRKHMHVAAADLEFEEAARLRDEVKRLEELELGV